MRITRILVPMDFSSDADAACSYAAALAATFAASLHLLHVVENPLAAGVWSSEIYTSEIAGLQINLVRDAEQRLRDYAADKAGVTDTEVRTGHVARVVLEFAKEKAIDLIVMGTHGRTGLAHAVMGSVAERVVRLAPCPVLTLRAETAGAADAARSAS